MDRDEKAKKEYEAPEEEQQTGQGDGSRPRRRGRGPSSILAPGEKPKDFRKAVMDTLRYMGAYKFAIAVVIVVSALATIFETLGPKVMGRATTLLAEGVMNKINGTGGIDFAAVRNVLLMTMALYFVGAIAQYIQALIMTNITQKIVYRMRRDISEKIDRMPMSYFEKVPTGEVLSRITNDVDTLGQSLSQSISNFIWAIISMSGIVVVMPPETSAPLSSRCPPRMLMCPLKRMTLWHVYSIRAMRRSKISSRMKAYLVIPISGLPGVSLTTRSFTL